MDTKQELTIDLRVTGMDSILGKLRSEVAGAIRAIAATETDGRVASRLFEVGAMVEQHISAAEAKLAMQNPTVHQPRVPLGAKPPVVATTPPPAPASLSLEVKR